MLRKLPTPSLLMILSYSEMKTSFIFAMSRQSFYALKQCQALRVNFLKSEIIGVKVIEDCRGIVWGLISRRNLNEMEESQLQSWLIILGDIFIPRDGKDRRVWMASVEGTFSVASLCQ